jgi:2-polyprenyl-3-methyl-5-hydroxy-6-metoxy-1,4-benzoquinol methylase
MISYSSTHRSNESEIMDDFELKGEEMKELLTDLKKVNKWLGGNQVTKNGIIKLLANRSKAETITILDLGCGDGELLRECARLARKEGYIFQLIGIDANAFILQEAKRRSEDFQNITFRKMDIFSEDIKKLQFDIALCTLFLHHFSNHDIQTIIQGVLKEAKIGIVINDLHRSRLAFWLFKAISLLILKTKIARHDGLVSVARGFKRSELEIMAKQFKKSVSIISWKWAFRYSWILKKV